MMEFLDARPILDLDMRLGEGTGAALAMNLIEAALDLFHSMATFGSAQVSGKVRCVHPNRHRIRHPVRSTVPVTEISSPSCGWLPAF